MNTLADCRVCEGRGYVPAPGTAKPQVDACPACTRRAQIEWNQRKGNDMARVKRPSVKVVTPRDAEEANLFLERIGAAERSRLLIQAALDEQVAQLRAQAEAEARPYELAVQQMSAGLQLWAEANRASLTRNGATKTVRLAGGELAWRLRPPMVRITGVDAVIETLRTLGLDRFLRVKTEIDKDAMLREPAEAGRVAGVRIASEGEEFVVTPASVELAGVAA